MLEEQPLCVADGCPGTEKKSPCCLRRRILAARPESSPVSDQCRRNGVRGISTGAQKRAGPSRRHSQFLGEGSQLPRGHPLIFHSDTPHAAASCTRRVYIRKQMCLQFSDNHGCFLRGTMSKRMVKQLGMICVWEKCMIRTGMEENTQSTVILMLSFGVQFTDSSILSEHCKNPKRRFQKGLAYTAHRD